MSNNDTQLSPTQVAAVKHLVGLSLRYMGIRNHSRQEVVFYLNRKYSPPDDGVIEAVLAQLDQFNILNDEVFAVEYAHYLLSKGKGPYVIKLNLKQKGVSETIITSTLISLSQKEIIAQAHHQAQKKIGRLPKIISYQDKMKLKQFLFAHGYDSEVINIVIDDLTTVAIK